ncbi:MAG: hypothetical protein QM811_00510 [Pirellulales bacterium]
MYCELLESAVRRMKRMAPRKSPHVHIDLPVEAYLPRNYVQDLRLKVDLYRRLSRTTQESDLQDLRVELIDRFGEIPAPVDKLLQLSSLRILAGTWGIDSIQREEIYAVFGYQDRARSSNWRNWRRGSCGSWTITARICRWMPARSRPRRS